MAIARPPFAYAPSNETLTAIPLPTLNTMVGVVLLMVLPRSTPRECALAD